VWEGVHCSRGPSPRTPTVRQVAEPAWGGIGRGAPVPEVRAWARSAERGARGARSAGARGRGGAGARERGSAGARERGAPAAEVNVATGAGSA
jgi:hypothetical protein